MQSTSLVRCKHCNKGLLMDRPGELFLKTKGLSFSKCPHMDGIAMVLCPHCRGENYAPIGFVWSD